MSRAPFYKKYRYLHKLSILAADQRGAIALEGRYFFNRVPKSANSSVTAALAKVSGKKIDNAFDAKAAFMRPSEMNFRQMAEFDDFFKFTFVRNPYPRVLSSYLDKIATGRKTHLIRNRDSRDMQLSFSQFCKYLDSGGLYVNAHWAPQTSLMLLPIDKFDFIGKVESFGHDLSYVVDRVAPGTVFTSTDWRSWGPTTHANNKIDFYYDDQCREIVRRLYRSDFECFGYAM